MNNRPFIAKIKDADGMSMVEVVFASVVLLGAIMIMISMFDTSISILSFTTTRSIAVQMATEEIENIRSMDYEQVYNKVPASWPSDPNLQTSPPPPKYKDIGDAADPVVWRDLVTTPTVGLTMERETTRKYINFKIRNYVLWVDDGTQTAAFKRLVVKVSWSSPGVPGEVVLTSNFAKTDTREPRPAVTITGIKSTNFNYFKGLTEDTTMGLDDSIRGPGAGLSTPVVYAKAQASSAKATGISRIVFTLLDRNGDQRDTYTADTADSQGYYKWSLSTTNPMKPMPNDMGYLVKAEAFDSLGNSDVTTLRINIDNTAPSTVTNFKINNEPSAYFRITLTWDWSAGATDTVPAISRFVVWRGPTGNLVKQAAMPASSRVFTDVGVTENYAYALTVVDTAGNVSAQTSVVRSRQKGSQTDFVNPLSVTTDTASPASWKAIDLQWAPTTDDLGVFGYYWSSSDDGVNWIIVGGTTQTVGNPLYYQDTGLKPGKTYRYVPYAFDDEGNVSSAGPTVWASTPLR